MRCGSQRRPLAPRAWRYRTALDSRASAARRRRREGRLDETAQLSVSPVEPQDWRPAFDREVGRLPAKLREAVVACELEGRTRAEAAALLGLPLGTLASRLAKARALLARRLSRLAPAAMAALVPESLAPAAVPTALCILTVHTVILVGAGAGCRRVVGRGRPHEGSVAKHVLDETEAGGWGGGPGGGAVLRGLSLRAGRPSPAPCGPSAASAPAGADAGRKESKPARAEPKADAALVNLKTKRVEVLKCLMKVRIAELEAGRGRVEDLLHELAADGGTQRWKSRQPPPSGSRPAWLTLR